MFFNDLRSGAGKGWDGDGRFRDGEIDIAGTTLEGGQAFAALDLIPEPRPVSRARQRCKFDWVEDLFQSGGPVAFPAFHGD
jgi:hypothetical protein